MKKIILFVIIACLFSLSLSAQSGGNFQIVQSVTGNSGETSSGGNFSLIGTSGQTTTQQSSQIPYSLYSGFWSSTFSPTAANASISGRIITADGRGIRNVTLQLTNLTTNETKTCRSGSFGRYNFADLESGETYILSVTAKRFSFSNPSRVITLSEDLADEDFVSDSK